MFYYEGILDGTGGKSGGRIAARSATRRPTGTKGASMSRAGTKSKAPAAKARSGGFLQQAGRVAGRVAGAAGRTAVAVANTLPVASSIVAGGQQLQQEIFGSPEDAVQAASSAGFPTMSVKAFQMPQGGIGYKPVLRGMGGRRKKRKGLSGSDLKGYMRTVKLAKMLVHTPRYMKKSIGKKRRRSSSF